LTIAAVKPGGWVINEKLTSSQMTSIQTNTTRAADKTANDTINAGWTFLEDGYIKLTLDSYINVKSGSSIIMDSGSNMLFNSGSGLTQSSGTSWTCNGLVVLHGLTSITGSATTISSPTTVTGNFTLDPSGHMYLDGYALASNLHMKNGARLKYDVRLISRVIRGIPWHLADQVTNTLYGGYFTLDNADCAMVFPIDVPDGCDWVGFEITMQGAAGHGGMPATKPSIHLYKIDCETGAGTALGSKTDPTSNTTDYQSFHTFGWDGVSSIIAAFGIGTDNTKYRYTAFVDTETGANALDGATFLPPIVHYYVLEQDDGAC